jgi:calcium-dependent protein kinase
MTDHTTLEAVQDDIVMQVQPGDFIRHHLVSGEAIHTVCDSYVIGRCLGVGAYGSVYSCTHKQTGVVRALKVMTKRKLAVDLPATSVAAGTATSAVKVVAERLKLCKETLEYYNTNMADHPNCVTAHACYEDSQKVYMVLDNYHGGDLLGAITSKLGCLSESSAALLINSILTTINHCHCQQGIAHLDLKLENIMFATESYRVEDAKVIDWGLSRAIQYDANGVVLPMTQTLGSVPYMAPQVFQGPYDPRKSDIWSIGVMTFMILAGYPPFEGETDLTTITKIMNHNTRNMFDADPTIWEQVSEEAKAFVASLMVFEEDQRPTAAQALQHPWLKDARARAVLGMDTRFQQDAVYRRAVQSVFEGLVLHSADVKSCVWREATSALLVSQYGVSGSMREIMEDCFRALDSNLDGVLTMDNLLHGLERFFPRGLQASSVDSIWTSLLGSSSEAKSKRINGLAYTDFVKAVSTEYLLSDDKRLEYAFSVFNQGSTFITHHSLRRALNQKQGQGNVDKVVETMMRHGGTRDGISFPEFVILVRQESAIVANNLNANVNPWRVVPRKGAQHDSFPEYWLDSIPFPVKYLWADGKEKKHELRTCSEDTVTSFSTISPKKKTRHNNIWSDFDLNAHNSAPMISGWPLHCSERQENSKERHCISPFLFI